MARSFTHYRYLTVRDGFLDLARWVSEGGYEAAGEALQIIHDQELCPSELEVEATERFISILRHGAPTAEQVDFANELEEIVLRSQC